MANFAPIRNAAGRIIGMQPKEEVGAFASVLQDTMQAVGIVEPEPEGKKHSGGGARYEAAAFVLGALLALALIAGLGLGRGAPVSTSVDKPAATLPAPPTRTIAPTRAPDPTIAPSPLPPTVEPPAPAAAPEPVVIVQPVEVRCYSVTINVLDARSYPIGTVEGSSCESQEAAQANAAQLAEQMREAKP